MKYRLIKQDTRIRKSFLAKNAKLRVLDIFPQECLTGLLACLTVQTQLFMVPDIPLSTQGSRVTRGPRQAAEQQCVAAVNRSVAVKSTRVTFLAEVPSTLLSYNRLSSSVAFTKVTQCLKNPWLY
jgi:hypothetical protein